MACQNSSIRLVNQSATLQERSVQDCKRAKHKTFSSLDDGWDKILVPTKTHIDILQIHIHKYKRNESYKRTGPFPKGNETKIYYELHNYVQVAILISVTRLLYCYDIVYLSAVDPQSL